MCVLYEFRSGVGTDHPDLPRSYGKYLVQIAKLVLGLPGVKLPRDKSQPPPGLAINETSEVFGGVLEFGGALPVAELMAMREVDC